MGGPASNESDSLPNVFWASRLITVKYPRAHVLTSKVVQASIVSILDSLKRSELEEAKRKIQALSPGVRSERERGGLLAAAGIYASMSKGKDGAMQTWDGARIERAAKSINASQLADEFDAGYAEALLTYSRLIADNQHSAA